MTYDRMFRVALVPLACLMALPGTAFAQSNAMKANIPQPGGTAAGGGTFDPRAKAFEVTGGAKPGDTVTLKLTVEHSGGSGTRNVPWTIFRDNDVVVGEGTRQVTAGSTGTFEVTATWTATAGSHAFYGEVDRHNTLNASQASVTNNLSATTTKVYSDWIKWSNDAFAATRSAMGQWGNAASLQDGQVKVTNLYGGRLTSGVSVASRVRTSLAASGAPSEVVEGFAAAFEEAWTAWANGWSIPEPGLPLFPTFAAYPGAYAKGVAAPFPVGSGTSAGRAKLQRAALSSAVRTRVGAPVNWASGSLAIDVYGEQVEASFITWLATAMLTGVNGEGAVPGYSLPAIPVSPMVKGKASGGRIASNYN